MPQRCTTRRCTTSPATPRPRLACCACWSAASTAGPASRRPRQPTATPLTAQVSVAKQEARGVVARLAAAGAVNDAAFAESRVRSLVRAGRSRRAIGAHLAAKGVGAEPQRHMLPDGATDTEFAAALVLARRRRIGPFRARRSTGRRRTASRTGDLRPRRLSAIGRRPRAGHRSIRGRGAGQPTPPLKPGTSTARRAVLVRSRANASLACTVALRLRGGTALAPWRCTCTVALRPPGGAAITRWAAIAPWSSRPHRPQTRSASPACAASLRCSR